MIKINLRNILNDQNISINELSKKTGISRTSLTPLINNESKMLQFETLNKIIKVLRVDVADIIKFVPDIYIDVDNIQIHKSPNYVSADVNFKDSESHHKNTVSASFEFERLSNVIVVDVLGDRNQKLDLLVNIISMQMSFNGGDNSPIKNNEKVVHALGNLTNGMKEKSELDKSEWMLTAQRINQLTNDLIKPLGVALARHVIINKDILEFLKIPKDQEVARLANNNIVFVLNLSVPEPKLSVNYGISHQQTNYTCTVTMRDLTDFYTKFG